MFSSLTCSLKPVASPLKSLPTRLPVYSFVAIGTHKAKLLLRSLGF